MKRETIEKAVCETCGVDARENTLFCYNCGSKLEIAAPFEANGTATADDKIKAALDDLADKLSHTESEEDKLAQAAIERKRARVTHRKRLEYKWEPRDDSSASSLIFAALVAFAALFVVILLVVWK